MTRGLLLMVGNSRLLVNLRGVAELKIRVVLSESKAFISKSILMKHSEFLSFDS